MEKVMNNWAVPAYGSHGGWLERDQQWFEEGAHKPVSQDSGLSQYSGELATGDGSLEAGCYPRGLMEIT
eukprot:CAMPEP_0174381586 /NCGR_PEP_ID=MMETSP0811_2-20130205/124109_1 /TAXON_ID=73025 ORGANISM="Eutreptiella gymnastica-like, Strain CCMP1594" /NCGR_SAMPLE_ID=MMETSP0811_2 /ASSEMBLY_ACC=CAM_ASM_000667 /LENGTH=68 /DNA_ID=CAMNT_0015534773 /DNA_START=1508 /DNA_END=1714 /DNA_ORIENTATION=+